MPYALCAVQGSQGADILHRDYPGCHLHRLLRRRHPLLEAPGAASTGGGCQSARQPHAATPRVRPFACRTCRMKPYLEKPVAEGVCRRVRFSIEMRDLIVGVTITTIVVVVMKGYISRLS